MSKYEISFTEEVWKVVVIEASNEEEARKKFWEFDFDETTERVTGGEVQESLDIEEVEEEE
jgi:hypothetical protein